MASWLIPAIAGKETAHLIVANPPASTPDEDIALVADLIFRYLRTLPNNRDRVIALLKMLFKLPRTFQPYRMTLAILAASDSTLQTEVPELTDPSIFGRWAFLVGRGFNHTEVIQIDPEQLPDQTINNLVQLLLAMAGPIKTWDFTE